MSGFFYLDWAILAVSLFNTILLLWLGLTVLLNAEHRTWGLWLAGGGMLMGGAFFLSHTAILGFGPDYLHHAANFWWRFGWTPVIFTPFAWYVVTLWYTGFWDSKSNPIYRRHHLWLWLLGGLCAAMIGMFLVTNPLPSFDQVAHLDLSAAISVQGVAVLILIYPVFITACVALALDALLRPGPTGRMMGQLARRRARPWLAAASFCLLLVSLMVGGFMLWAAMNARQVLLNTTLAIQAIWADLIISTLIAIAIILIGQGVVSYEVFTGRTLPRRGLLRFWRRALVLAAGYSISVSLSLALNLTPIYILLLSACLLVLFYALVSWRSYVDRERFMADLRPFMANPELLNHLLHAPDQSSFSVQKPFCALCTNVLGTHSGFLVPLGASGPLFGPALSCPEGVPPPLANLNEMIEHLTAQALCVPIDASQFAGASWAVPLWNERGLCGALLLGEKMDGGLYSQEEIEIARSAGERLVDMQASAQMARRLMSIQRQRLADGQVADRRARRVLHDDVLPRLHAVLLTLSSQADPLEERQEAIHTLVEVHHQISDLLRDLPAVTTPEVLRLGLIGALEQVLQGEMKDSFERVDWQVEPEAVMQADRLPPLVAEAVFYAVREVLRNAARHARPPDSRIPLELKIRMVCKNGLEIAVEDNGVGITTSTPSNGGSGQGLALHSTLLAVLGGSLAVESIPGAFTRVCISLPQTV
jgi:signal transduction histidine kinase